MGLLQTRGLIIDSSDFGVSVSVKQSRSFGLEATDVIRFVVDEIGLRRFRLMSYWDEIEQTQGEYNFTELDRQLEAAKVLDAEVTLCLGMRQPRWPETHIPDWAKELPQNERYRALYSFIEHVVRRYRDNKQIVSWQLENEALNRGFGKSGDFNRQRLRIEAMLVRELDDTRLLIMSLSDTIGVPLRRPRPDRYAVSFYRIVHRQGEYKPPRVPWWWHKIRGSLIRLTTGQSMFIHELQAEPWGPKATWKMDDNQQAESMNNDQLRKNIQLAIKTGLFPIDLWGAEWWYRRWLDGDTSIAETVKAELNYSSNS